MNTTPNGTPSPDQPDRPRILNIDRMRRPAVPAAAKHDENELIGFQIVEKLWTQIRDIMAEMDMPEERLRLALKEGHGITIAPGLNPKLYFIVSQYQKEGLRRAGVENPTWFQLIGSSECWAMSAEECERRFRRLKGEQPNPFECKHVQFSVACQSKLPLKVKLDLIAVARARAAMQLYKDCTPDERESIATMDLEPARGDDVTYRGVMFVDPDIGEDRNLWKERLDMIAAGTSEKFDENGEIRR